MFSTEELPQNLFNNHENLLDVIKAIEIEKNEVSEKEKKLEAKLEICKKRKEELEVRLKKLKKAAESKFEVAGGGLSAANEPDLTKTSDGSSVVPDLLSPRSHWDEPSSPRHSKQLATKKESEPFRTLLHNSLFLNNFKVYLNRRGKLDLIGFYMYVEKYRAITARAKLRQTAEQIWNIYFRKKKIVKSEIKKNLEKLIGQGHFDIAMFDVAQLDVFNYLKDYEYPKFLRTKEAKEWLNTKPPSPDNKLNYSTSESEGLSTLSEENTSIDNKINGFELQFPSSFKTPKSADPPLSPTKKSKHVKKPSKSDDQSIQHYKDFPSEFRHKIQRFKDVQQEELNQNLPLLVNIINFLYKKNFTLENQEPPKKDKMPLISTELFEIAKREIKNPPTNIKKMFKILEKAGDGSFASVFKASNLSSKEIVAIKKCPFSSNAERDSIISEIGCLKKFENNNNILPLRSAWEISEKKEIWIVTEYLEAGSLSEATKVHKFSEKHMAYIVKEVLKGIKFMHYFGFAHRDLKSSNIMMSLEGDIKIVDFGYCADLSGGERFGTFGSPFWVSPEMIQGRSHSYQVDIWALGVCILEMILGEPPHNFSTFYAMWKVGTVGFCDTIPSNISSNCKDFLRRCLNIDPHNRATAIELLEHKFVNLASSDLRAGLQKVLSEILLSNQLLKAGVTTV